MCSGFAESLPERAVQMGASPCAAGFQAALNPFPAKRMCAAVSLNLFPKEPCRWAPPLALLAFQQFLTLSLPKNVCSGFNLFPKEPCRWVKPTGTIHFSRTWSLTSMDERPEFEQGVRPMPSFLARGQRFAIDVIIMASCGQGKG